MGHRPSCDILIVGAGSAGCILASQLAGRHGYRVTLIEPPAKEAPAASRERPANWIRLLGGDEDWDFATSPDSGLAGRALRWPRGRGLGGSSRINAMIWAEPTRRDFARWVASSGAKWEVGALRQALSEVRNLVRPESPPWISESSKRFLRTAADEVRAQVYPRFNRDGIRWNPASLLTEYLDDGRVCLIRASVDQIQFENDRAVGVIIEDGETTQLIRCSDRVILCSGSIASPCILMRSGIGPLDVLNEHKIEMRVELPGVGSNLRDHLIMPVVFGIAPSQRFPTHASVRDIVRWETIQGGPLASNLAECGGLSKDQSVQFHVTPTHYLLHPSERAPAAMTIGVNATDPQSTGRVVLSSRRLQSPPRITANYLSAPNDGITTIAGVRLARQLASREALANWVTGEILPGEKRDNDRALAKSIARYAQTLYHPVGTCAMGRRHTSVVDESLAVRGTENLFVVDASVLPSLTSGNPTASIMTIAYHFAKAFS